MDDEDRLIPKPHMLKSIRSRNWKLEGAIEELVDNSLGHGRAHNVDIIIDHISKAIVVHDDGIGIDDVNRIFRYGDASAHDVLTEIGQYGVGATNAVVYLGDVTEVHTVRDSRKHTMTVDWAEVERSGEWPKRYRGNGTRPLADERGTMVIVGELARARGWRFSTSQRMAGEFGRVFAPAVRTGKRIRILHRYAKGEEQLLTVEPFNPPDLTDEVPIAGEVPTASGVLKWTGRAGLSASLTDRHNGVHIAFGHRVIETTKEPFGTKSAPTLYCEITLDPTTPWKHALSEHKDEVVHHRDELIGSIHAEIESLLEKSAQQASHLALHGMIAPIEAALTKALKGAGVLVCGPG
jgi:anti-sigma regulatory factor (Ser/Thr protein kinase)